MKVTEIENAEAVYRASYMRIGRIEKYELTCMGCGQSMPVGAFFIKGRDAKLCMDCSEACQTLSRKFSPDQKAASRVTWFTDPGDYLDSYRLRVTPATELFEVKVVRSGHWYKTTKAYFLHCVTFRGYKKHQHESEINGRDVYYQEKQP